MRSALNPRTGGAPPWYQKSLLRYFDAISTFLQNFARFLKRSALNPHTGGAPGPPLVTPQTSKIYRNLSKIYRKSIEHLSKFYRKSIENL